MTDVEASEAALPAPAAPGTPAATPAPAVSTRVSRPHRPDRPERLNPNVATLGYRPSRAGDSVVPSWLWAAVGLFALGAVLAAAIQIANQPPPLAIPNADKAQLARAESLRVVLRRDTTAVAPNVALGNLFYDTGNFGQAIPYYKRALRRDATLTDVRVDLGVSYHNAGQPDSAIQTLERVIAEHPDHAIAHFDLAVLYQSMGRTDQALAHFKTARSLPGPEEMHRMIDQLLARIEGAPAPGGAGAPGALPPGHPPLPEGSSKSP